MNTLFSENTGKLWDWTKLPPILTVCDKSHEVLFDKFDHVVEEMPNSSDLKCGLIIS